MPKITKEDAKEKGRKGGKANKGKSSIRRSVSRRKNCNPKCVIYERCPYMIQSKKYEGKCALNKMDREVQRWTYDLLEGGSEDILRTLRDLVLMIVTDAKDFKKRLQASDKIRELHEAIYGKKGKIEVESNIKGEISIIDEFKKAMKEVKE